MKDINENGEDKKLKLFVSYAHEDVVFLKRLKVHLARPIFDFGFEFWDDSKINLGDRWAYEIENALNESSIVILLISADFLASNFIVNQELPKILVKEKKAGTKIIPIIIGPCGFDDDPILSQFQALNSSEDYIAKFDKYKQDEYWDLLRRKVRKTIENISEEQAQALEETAALEEDKVASNGQSKRKKRTTSN